MGCGEICLVPWAPSQHLIALRPSSYVCACCQNVNWGTKTTVKVKTCDKAKVAALPRSRTRTMAEVRDAPKEVSENQRCEDNPCSAAHYSPLSSNLLRDIVKGTEQSCCAQAECSGPTGHAVGHVEFQRQRADIADGQTLTTSQYYLHHYEAPSGLS